MEKNTAKPGLTRPDSFSTLPPEIESAMMASKTRPTPVIRKPDMATQVLVPAAWPSGGAKMILPAPRNMENRKNDSARNCRKLMGWDMFGVPVFIGKAA
ncbi:hypothetical protein J2T28_002465 [Kerstersia gyiorum]|nr:hypothetical protein [Kerstersia gyiorum]MCP1637357.1 hypothetical protein [Kerstersia gyiorum]